MRGRKSKRIWFVALGVFVAVFLFSFLIQKYKNNNSVDAASLAKFNPGYIISDYQMGNYNSMSEADIQKFLTSKNSCSNTNYNYYKTLSANKNYKWHWANGHFVCLSEERFGDGEVIGSGQTAAHIIYRAAQDYKINPQVLIVLLQKETSLITDPIPNDKDYRKAAGYGCPDNAACSSKYYGFKNQIRNAAKLFRTVLDGGWTNFPLGNNYIQYNPNKSCGGSTVNVKTLATSALYRYTPYQPNAGALAAGYGTASCGAYGNRNFYLYFQDWFGGITRTSGRPSAPRSIMQSSNIWNRSITIKWKSPADNGGANITKYEVVIAGKKAGGIKAEVTSNTYEYTFKNLPVDTYYAASVKAFNKSGDNYDRITFNTNVKETKTSAPRSISSNGNGRKITIKWKKPVDTGGAAISKYEVVIAGRQTKETKVVVAGNVYEYTFDNLLADEYYAASVKAFNNTSNAYDRITFNIKIASSKPSKPRNIKYQNNDGKVKISWDKPLNTGGVAIDKYEVVIAGRKTGERKKIVSSNVYDFTFGVLPADTYYAASVKAINSVGEDYGRITFNIVKSK